MRYWIWSFLWFNTHSIIKFLFQTQRTVTRYPDPYTSNCTSDWSLSNLTELVPNTTTFPYNLLVRFLLMVNFEALNALKQFFLPSNVTDSVCLTTSGLNVTAFIRPILILMTTGICPKSGKTCWIILDNTFMSIYYVYFHENVFTTSYHLSNLSNTRKNVQKWHRTMWPYKWWVRYRLCECSHRGDGCRQKELHL